MQNWNSRTELLLGPEKLGKINGAHVLVVGLGGVGAAAAEMMARAGTGRLTLLDTDVVEASNRNRQLCALSSTEGIGKAEVVAARLKDINPQLEVNVMATFLSEETIKDILDKGPYDYVLDCIDTLQPKVFLIYNTLLRGFPLVSSMGAGGRIDPGMVRVGDLSETHNCHLAQAVRKHLKKLKVYGGYPCVYSPEEVDKTRLLIKNDMRNKKSVIGTISYMPNVFGCFVAGVALRGLLGMKV